MVYFYPQKQVMIQRRVVQAVEIQSDLLAAAGRRVYLKEGCPECHTRFIRRSVADLIRYMPEYYYKIKTPVVLYKELFLKRQGDAFGHRIGPDLEFLPDWMFQSAFLEAYIKNPSRFHRNSIMPSYQGLFSEALYQGEYGDKDLNGQAVDKDSIAGYSRGQALLFYLRSNNFPRLYRQ